jgi:hypothetical protein
MKINTKYGSFNVRPAHYNGNLVFLDRNGSPVLKAGPIVEGRLYLKTWSENEGILETLTEAGFVSDTGERVPTGFCEYVVCDLLVKF